MNRVEKSWSSCLFFNIFIWLNKMNKRNLGFIPQFQYSILESPHKKKYYKIGKETIRSRRNEWWEHITTTWIDARWFLVWLVSCGISSRSALLIVLAFSNKPYHCLQRTHRAFSCPIEKPRGDHSAPLFLIQCARDWCRGSNNWYKQHKPKLHRLQVPALPL